MLDEDGRTVGEVLGPFFEVELAKFLSVDSNTKTISFSSFDARHHQYILFRGRRQGCTVKSEEVSGCQK